jgi:hypothetical protein
MRPLNRSIVSAALLVLVASCGASGGRANVSPGVMPEGGSFGGVWNSPQYGRMDMVQNGATIVGEYTKNERSGRIEGTAQGDLMRFTWSERRELVAGVPRLNRGRGYFRLVKDAEGFKLIGEWGHDDDETGGGPWNAIHTRWRPRLSTDSGNSSGGESGDSGGEGDGDGGGVEETGEAGESGGDDGLGDL